jgi:V/A-type H+-transporting ATPase subunit F
MAAVGERDAVLAFKAMGMTVIPAAQADEAAAAVRKLAREGMAVIFITEQAAGLIPDTLARYQNEPVPAIIPIPGSRGSAGLGMQRLKANVEKAIGADILFEKEG